MNYGEHTWALVLAAGEGARLRCLTTTSDGVAVPKQFCALQSGPSLLQEALERAAAVAPMERICTVVAQQHRRWWGPALQSLPPANVIVQPENRGTANGILLPLLHILQRDPDAQLVLLPSDHYVRDEATLAKSLHRALGQSATREREIVLLGLEPDEVDPDLGYIIPGEDDRGALTVRRFVEKPSAAAAQELIRAGALWNVFIVAARGKALLDLFVQSYPQIVAQMGEVAAQDANCTSTPSAAPQVYRTLPDIDFSRHVLQGAERRLRVLPSQACGWSDLGTPERVARILRRTRDAQETFEAREIPLSAHLSLARQHALIHSA